MTYDDSPEPYMTHISPGDPSVEVAERSDFSVKTNRALSQVSNASGWFFGPGQQMIKEVGDYALIGFPHYASNARLTWIVTEFEPLGLKPLLWEITYGRATAEATVWDLPTRARYVTRPELPEFKKAGWSDADIPPEENAGRIIASLERISEEIPTGIDYSERFGGERFPRFTRAAHALSLILEGKHEEALALVEPHLEREGPTYEKAIFAWLVEQG